MAYGICVLEKMSGTDNAVDLVSARYAPSSTETAIDNGNVVLLGALESGSREVRVATTPARDSAKANIALVATPVVQYNERLVRDESNFQNAAGDVIRGYLLEKPHQWFSITADALDGYASAAVGYVIELIAGTKLSAASTLTGGSTQIGVLRETYTKRGKTYYVVETV